ncbi:MAG: lipoprotein-releasing ABC transporter ATP-binding protein LolD [bacterium]
MNNSSQLLIAKDVVRSYQDGTRQVDVLKGVNLSISTAETLSIIGASGSGKSTLMHLLGGLEIANAGNILFEGKDLALLSQHERAAIRGQSLGFVYQFHHLLAEFSALENVAMPLLIAGMSPDQAESKAEQVLGSVGLAQRVSHRPAQLSGGERQRAAIARALVNQPRLILADEPTGNLDEKTANETFELLLEMNQKYSTAMVVVTHDKSLAAKTGRVLNLTDGVLV